MIPTVGHIVSEQQRHWILDQVSPAQGFTETCKLEVRDIACLLKKNRSQNPSCNFVTLLRLKKEFVRFLSGPTCEDKKCLKYLAILFL